MVMALESIGLVQITKGQEDSSTFLSINTIIALTFFSSLIGACIIIGHLLKDNRWANESITALLLVLYDILMENLSHQFFLDFF